MKIHFIGIGGIGVSALAKYYLARGARVSGSDLVSSEITEELKNQGVEIYIGKHRKTNIPKDATHVIYTAAVTKDNPELKAALEAAQNSSERHLKRRQRSSERSLANARNGGLAEKIIVQSYAEAVGELTRKYETIAISGSHGKSTTTALTALVLEEGYCDPTVLIGTKVKEFGNSNFRQGRGRNLVLEADEWNRSFHNYFPKIAVITNIDAEHLDTYKTVGAVERAFEKYLAKIPKDGALIANYDDPRTRKVAKKFGRLVHWYSLKDWDAPLIRRVLRIPGEHNVSNALAASCIGRLFGIKEGHILSALSRFSGCWRRFEWKGFLKGANIISDYGHHPAEIYATIRAARKRFPFRRIWCVYQPHQYQRLKYLWKEFIPAFDMADRIALLPVYEVAGRETKNVKETVNSENLSRELIKRGKNATYHQTFKEAEDYILTYLRPGDILLVMGAGNIHHLADQLLAP